MNVKSPITGSDRTVLDKTIETSVIIHAYFNNFKIDVSHFFKGLDYIYVYKCLDTGYRFYYPFTVAGDGKFYEQLQKIDWYYMSWKWEHEIASALIKVSDKVLEVGCAKGDFIRHLSKKGLECVGLELNESAVTEGKLHGLHILNESIQEHALKMKGYYNVVTSFQVVEHISEIQSFIKSSIDALAPSGILIISVPNMSSFFKYDEQNTLNMPPHHMGLWDEYSLRKIEQLFPVKFVKYFIEPLQEYHTGFYVSSKLRQFKLHQYGLLGKVVRKVAHKYYTLLATKFRKKVKGVTILAVFKKDFE